MKFLDFFSGIGGFRLGLEVNGFKCVGWCECDPFCPNCKKITKHILHSTKNNVTICQSCGKEKIQYARRSYEAIHETKDEWTTADITAVRTDELPEADIYCAGFPCQAFSIAGNRGGFEDTRGTLVFEVLRLAKERKPKILFFENVKGLLSHDKGRTFATIISAISELGYDVEWQLHNSVNFGVPQNRERVFIIGHLRGECRRAVFPITSTGGQTDIPIKIIAHKKGYRRNMQTFAPDGVIEAIDTGQGGGRGPLGAIIDKKGKVKNREYASCLTGGGHSGGNHSDMDLLCIPCLTPDRAEKRQNGRRFKEDGEPMFTLTAQDIHGVACIDLKESSSKTRKSNPKSVANTLDKDCYQGIVLPKHVPTPNDVINTVRTGGKGSISVKHLWDVVFDWIRIRRLTPLECWRLQGFPDDAFYKAQKVNSNTQLYKQAGNSVTVNVIAEIGKSIKESYAARA